MIQGKLWIGKAKIFLNIPLQVTTFRHALCSKTLAIFIGRTNL
jgi:hypothetical protein